MCTSLFPTVKLTWIFQIKLTIFSLDLLEKVTKCYHSNWINYLKSINWCDLFGNWIFFLYFRAHSDHIEKRKTIEWIRLNYLKCGSRLKKRVSDLKRVTNFLFRLTAIRKTMKREKRNRDTYVCGHIQSHTYDIDSHMSLVSNDTSRLSIIFQFTVFKTQITGPKASARRVCEWKIMIHFSKAITVITY